jgi:hypothetical protein
VTPRDAERIIRRRARALASLRLVDSAAPLRVDLLCDAAEKGGWQSRVLVREKLHIPLVDVRATADDPTAALLALPAALEREVEAAISRLRAALDEGVDGAELVESEATAAAPPAESSYPSRAPRPRRPRAEKPAATAPPRLEVIGGRDG